MATINQRKIKVNGINLHIAEAGKGPLVIMVHGFPELWYSWRHQIPALADAGYHAVAIDLRGYGESDISRDLKSYSLLNLSKDIHELITVLGEKKAIIVGHDWGANITWAFSQIYPQQTEALVVMSVPYYPEPIGPIEKIKKFSPGKFNFADYFQVPGVAEEELEEDPERTIRLLIHALSGEAPKGLLEKLFTGKPETAKMLEGMPEPPSLPEWFSPQDLKYYAGTFKKTGFYGALGFYRNIDSDYDTLLKYRSVAITQPVLFIAGEYDTPVKFGSLEPMKKALPNLSKTVILKGCGHWVQQERPEEVADELIAFLNREIKGEEL